MFRNRIVGAVLAVGTLGAGVLAPSAVSAQAPTTAAHPMHGVHCYARMHPTAGGGHGGAWYEAHHGWREFEINLWDAHRYGGKRVIVTVHGTFVGRMRLSPDGHAHLYRHSGLPRMGRGDAVRVRTRAGKLVSYGTFRSMRNHHHPGMWTLH